MNPELLKALEAMAQVGNQLAILSEVLEERRRQINELEYPPEHDDQHDFAEFAWIIIDYCERIRVHEGTCESPSDVDLAKMREWFVKISAMGLSAVESLDRRTNATDN